MKRNGLKIWWVWNVWQLQIVTEEEGEYYVYKKKLSVFVCECITYLLILFKKSCKKSECEDWSWCRNEGERAK